MSIFQKITELSSQIASSILKREKPEALANSDLFTEEDKEYILEHLTNEKLVKKRSALLQQINRKEGWATIQDKIEVPVRKLPIWKYASAAAVLVLASIIYFSKNHLQEKQPDKVVVTKSVINPGTDKAILVLANGQQVALGKGAKYNSKGVHSNGTEIIYNNESGETAIAYNYLTIPRGGQFFIKLADGTKVWLNSESQLKFPVSFVDGKPRKVELVYGEAYFDVSPSTAHKGSHFNVETQNQNVEVLGTEFNIKAYQDAQAISTTLVEGKVNLSGSFTTTILKPGEQSVLENHRIRVASVDVFNEVSWKEGIFSFQEMPLKEIMKVLERWYDIKTVFKNKSIENSTFNGILDKDQKIEEILNIISNTNKIPYEINQKTVIFK